MNISKELKIGIISIVVLILTIWGYNFLKGKNIVKPSYEYFVVFDRIDGLIESGNIFLKGYKVGNINSITFDQANTGKFILKIVLEEKIDIPLNSTVNVKSSSLIASASDLEIVFSDAKEYYSPGDTLNSVANKGMAEILEPLQDDFASILKGVDSLVNNVNTILNTETQQDLQQAITDLADILGNIDNKLGPGGEISQTLAHLNSITGNLAKNNDNISNSLENIEHITTAVDSADIFTTITSLNQNLAELSVILKKVDEENGTLGLLLNDSSLYTNLDSTVYNLDKLLIDLKEHPKRYVHFSMFGKKDK